MSWHCSLALVEEFSARGCLDSVQCAQLKSIRTVGKCSFEGKKRATWNPFPSGTMCEPLTVYRGVVSWMSSLADSHVNRSHKLVKALRKRSAQYVAGNHPNHSRSGAGLLPPGKRAGTSSERLFWNHTRATCRSGVQCRVGCYFSRRVWSPSHPTKALDTCLLQPRQATEAIKAAQRGE